MYLQDDEKEKTYQTKDYTFKKFREKLNIWLKSVGKELGVDYDLYAYVFRHTAITVALDSGLPICNGGRDKHRDDPRALL